MALSDPFGTTYEGAYKSGLSLGAGIGTAAEKIGEGLEKRRQKQQTQQMLQKFGLLNPDGSINTDQAEKVGMDYNLTKGELSFKPASKKISLGAAGVTPQQDISSTVEGVFEGNIPPEKLASWRDVTRVNAELQRKSKETGINYPDLVLEWDATKKFVSSANSTQQVRLRQAIDFAQQSTKDLKTLSQEFKRSNFPILNRAQLVAAMNGAYGQDAAKKATVFNQQLTDIVADLGNVYMGGNSPTDEGLRLAQQNLQSNWSIDQLDAAIDNVDKLLTFRGNSIKRAAPMVKGEYGTTYYPQPNIMDTEQGKALQGAQKEKSSGFKILRVRPVGGQ